MRVTIQGQSVTDDCRKPGRMCTSHGVLPQATSVPYPVNVGRWTQPRRMHLVNIEHHVIGVLPPQVPVAQDPDSVCCLTGKKHIAGGQDDRGSVTSMASKQL
jgi:hypothetical protein